MSERPRRRVRSVPTFIRIDETRMGAEGRQVREKNNTNLRRDKHPLTRCLRRSLMVALLSVRLEMVITSKARARVKQIIMIPNSQLC